jgi:xanthine dehydrogenase accessory factor
LWFNIDMPSPVIIRGGGDLATGVALRLHRSGYPIIITELAHPLAVRRAVSFSEAIFEGRWDVEGIIALKAQTVKQALDFAQSGSVAVLIAPELDPIIPAIDDRPGISAIVDARLLKRPLQTSLAKIFTIGLGPGFIAGESCHAVLETQRGHNLGRVYWLGPALPDTGLPEGDPRRVLRAPRDGIITGFVEIGDYVDEGQVVARIGAVPIVSPFKGVVRGLIRPGLYVSKGLKIGDIDPRGVRDYCFTASDKALAVGGGVLEAILSSKK